MKTQIAKTRIYSAADLKQGDVIFIIERRQLERNKVSKNPIPVCNFYRLTVVRSIEQFDSGEWIYNCERHEKLTSTNGDHKVVLQALENNVILENGTFGANQRVNEHYEVYRLDSIKNKKTVFQGSVNLFRNPAYDLMHDARRYN